MFYHHRFMFGSIDSASACAESSFVRRRWRRAPSLWGFGAAAGLLSFPLRARSSESDSGPESDPAELAGELCSVPIEGALVVPEACDSPTEAASREPALLTVLGSDVRLEDLPGLPGLPEQQEDLILAQAPEGTAAGGGGLFGLSWPVVALVGGGGLLVVAVIASGGSDSDDGGSTSGSGDNGGDNGNGGGTMNVAPTTTTDAPVTLTAMEGVAADWPVSDWFSDPDGDTLTYTVSGNPAWLMLDAMTGALTIAAGATDDAEVAASPYTLTVTASDGDDETAVLTVTLEVENTNDAPVVVTMGDLPAPETLTATEGVAADWDVSAWFSDPDGDALTYAGTLQSPGAAADDEAAALSELDWLALDAMTGTLAIEADDGEVGTHTLVITATDAAADTAVHTLTLAVEDVAEPPVVVLTAPETLTAEEAAAASWDVSAWFDDGDTNLPSSPDSLAYTGTLRAASAAEGDEPEALSAVAWLALDGATGALTIAADATDDAEVGTYTLAITATDEAASAATHTLMLEVTNLAEAPVVVAGDSAPPATLTAMAGAVAAMTWDVTDWFDDPDLAVSGDIDSLEYTAMVLQGSGESQTAEALPAWLALDEETGVLTIAADTTADAVGTHTLAVTASDTTEPTALTAVHTVVLTVAPDRSEPRVSAGLSNRIAPAAEMSLVLDLAPFFTDLQEDGTTRGDLTFAVSDSIDDKAAADENIVTAELTGSMLTLTPGTAAASGGLWEQETVSITATDTDGQQIVGSFAVSTRANVLDTSTLAPAHGFILEGEAFQRGTASSALGSSVSGAGDINGDGIDDLILFTGSGGDFGLSRAGIVYGRAVTDGTQFGEAVTISVSVDASDSRNNETMTITEGPAPEGSVVRRVVKISDLARADGFFLQAAGPSENFGASVSGAGDINGDGIEDLIVGTHENKDGGRDAGAAYIVYGQAGADGTQLGVREVVGADGMTTLLDAEASVPADAELVRRLVDVAKLSPATGFIIQGEGSDSLGASVAGAGDINGDGIEDLIVGAPILSGSVYPIGGRTHIVYGKLDTDGDGTQFGEAVTISVSLDTSIPADPVPVTTTITAEEAPKGSVVRQVVDVAKLSPTDGFILQGDRRDDELGWSVSGAGDVNGDGLADLIVVAFSGDDGGNSAGEAYVIYGKAGNGAQFGEAVTISVSVDTSDSSNNETMTITEGPAPEGSVVRQVLDTTTLAPADGFILQGDRAGDNLGQSVSGAGDINGDGLDDLIVGAAAGDDGGNLAGEAYIVYGKAGTDGTQFGMAVRLAADGTTTITDGSMPDGSVVRQVLDTSSLAPSDGFILQGDAASDAFGRSVAVAGDVNGDGLADLIVGAYFGDDGGMDAGEAYIIYGKAGTDGTQFGMAVRLDSEGVPITDGSAPEDSVLRQVLDTTGLAPTDGFILQGDAALDWLGESVSGAGDINGDGFDDLIAGAREGDDGGMSAGEAYVIYGGTHLGEVVSHDQTLAGAASEASLLGGAGDDRLEAHADTEVLYGGAGDDVLELADASFRRVDGGSGSDTLVLGMGVALDFTEASDRGRVRGIETLSLSDATAMVTLDLVSVYALVDSRDNGGTLTDAGEAFLRLEGVSGAMVVLSDTASWTVETADAEGTADLYEQASAKLLIDDGLLA